jgi:hypothetical protein
MNRLTKKIFKRAGTVIDIYPVKHKYTPKRYNCNKIDAKELEKDWKRTGDTLWPIVARKYEN